MIRSIIKFVLYSLKHQIVKLGMSLFSLKYLSKRKKVKKLFYFNK